jgi:hypothetical protein
VSVDRKTNKPQFESVRLKNVELRRDFKDLQSLWPIPSLQLDHLRRSDKFDELDDSEERALGATEGLSEPDQ